MATDIMDKEVNNETKDHTAIRKVVGHIMTIESC